MEPMTMLAIAQGANMLGGLFGGGGGGGSKSKAPKAPKIPSPEEMRRYLIPIGTEMNPGWPGIGGGTLNTFPGVSNLSGGTAGGGGGGIGQMLTQAAPSILSAALGATRSSPLSMMPGAMGGLGFGGMSRAAGGMWDLRNIGGMF